MQPSRRLRSPARRRDRRPTSGLPPAPAAAARDAARRTGERGRGPAAPRRRGTRPPSPGARRAAGGSSAAASSCCWSSSASARARCCSSAASAPASRSWRRPAARSRRSGCSPATPGTTVTFQAARGIDAADGPRLACEVIEPTLRGDRARGRRLGPGQPRGRRHRLGRDRLRPLRRRRGGARYDRGMEPAQARATGPATRSTAVVIPVRSFEDAKSRLGAVLDPRSAATSSSGCSGRTVAAALATDGVTDVVVVSPDAEVLRRRARPPAPAPSPSGRAA